MSPPAREAVVPCFQSWASNWLIPQPSSQIAMSRLPALAGTLEDGSGKAGRAVALIKCTQPICNQPSSGQGAQYTEPTAPHIVAAACYEHSILLPRTPAWSIRDDRGRSMGPNQFLQPMAAARPRSHPRRL